MVTYKLSKKPPQKWIFSQKGEGAKVWGFILLPEKISQKKKKNSTLLMTMPRKFMSGLNPKWRAFVPRYLPYLVKLSAPKPHILGQPHLGI